MPRMIYNAGLAAALAEAAAFQCAAVQASHEQVLYSFNSQTASLPSGVIRDSAGNLYGTTLSAGINNRGTVFRQPTT